MRSKPILGVIGMCVCLSGCQVPADIAYRGGVEAWRPQGIAAEAPRRRGQAPYWPTSWDRGPNQAERTAAASVPPVEASRAEPEAPPETEDIALAPAPAVEPIQFHSAREASHDPRPEVSEKKPVASAPAVPLDRNAPLPKLAVPGPAVPNTAARKTPHNADMLYQVGTVAMQAGAVEEALAWFNDALREDPNHAPSHQALMEHYQKTGDSARAARHRAKAHLPAPASAPSAAGSGESSASLPGDPVGRTIQ